jgi:hypothetical protein
VKTQQRLFLSALALMLALSAPSMFLVQTTSVHWYGAPAISVFDIGLVHPASGTMRLGTLTARIIVYEKGQYAIGETAEGGLLDISFTTGGWRYTGIEGTAQGYVLAWW